MILVKEISSYILDIYVRISQHHANIQAATLPLLIVALLFLFYNEHYYVHFLVRLFKNLPGSIKTSPLYVRPLTLVNACMISLYGIIINSKLIYADISFLI